MHTLAKCVVASVLLLSNWLSPGQAAERPNILFAIADDLSLIHI